MWFLANLSFSLCCIKETFEVRLFSYVEWASCFSRRPSFLSLADWLLGALLFSGGACSCHPAGTQHRIQTDFKPSGGESSYTLPPSFCLLLSCTCSFFSPSCSATSSSHSLSSSFPPLIYCPHLLSAYSKSYLLQTVHVKKACDLYGHCPDLFALSLIQVHVPLLLLQLVNALKTVPLLEVNVVDYKYKWVMECLPQYYRNYSVLLSIGQGCNSAVFKLCNSDSVYTMKMIDVRLPVCLSGMFPFWCSWGSPTTLTSS